MQLSCARVLGEICARKRRHRAKVRRHRNVVAAETATEVAHMSKLSGRVWETSTANSKRAPLKALFARCHGEEINFEDCVRAYDRK